MTIQLRQICLVARELRPVIDDLTYVLGIKSCFVDPGVGAFGLENTLMCVGRNFLEVVAPIEENTAGGRFLDRRGGDGGYMVICQANSREEQQAVRQRALDNGIRIAHESDRSDWGICQIHPRDMVSSFFEIDWMKPNDFTGWWMPSGGMQWEDKVDQTSTIDYLGVELQSEDPAEVSDRWSKVSGVPSILVGSEVHIRFNNATLRFVEATDGRGPGLGGLDVSVANRSGILQRAKERGGYVNDHQVELCGTRFYLKD
ncbi:MAG: hypothetical protein OXG24_05000 [Gammaproteobacteria bacterium]|nr:hypothetical protein [Gammaproteobacteria bacterium]